jgi:uncharacterized protein
MCDDRPVSGERDLDAILRALDVERRPGAFAYVLGISGGPPAPGMFAMVDEGGTTAYVVDADSPLGEQAPFRAAWLTLTVHSALEAVGLTAAVATALAAAGIPANVLAGFYHDHILVPEERADEAIAVLRSLGGR